VAAADEPLVINFDAQHASEPDQRGQHPGRSHLGVAEAVSEKVDGVALPRAAQDFRDRGRQRGVGVGNGELDADQAPSDQTTQNAV
jgi:hypothetical protein